ncbi:MAG: hypothetical protein ACI8ZB_000821 [Desulforhopalus sp.]|jgi:hypothetical protein
MSPTDVILHRAIPRPQNEPEQQMGFVIFVALILLQFTLHYKAKINITSIFVLLTAIKPSGLRKNNYISKG